MCESLIILFSFFPSLLFFDKSLRTICFSLAVCFPRIQSLFEILEQQSCSKYGQPTCNYAGMSTLPLRVGSALVNQRAPPDSETGPPAGPCGGPTPSPASEGGKPAHNYAHCLGRSTGGFTLKTSAGTHSVPMEKMNRLLRPLLGPALPVQGLGFHRRLL